jgi:hypothetical protein
MPALRVAKHELFAQAIADGKAVLIAHEMAGYKADARNAAALRKRVDVSQRINEILTAREAKTEKSTARAIELSGITKARIMSEMGAIAFSDIRKVMKWGTLTVTDEEGNTSLIYGLQLKDSAELDDATAAAISEVSQSRDGTIRVKFHNKPEALLRIGKEIGMFIERIDATVAMGTPEQIERARQARDRLVTVLEHEEDRWHKPAQLPAPSGQKQANGKG